MNSQEQNLTPTDLVYLFVDGEASDLEQTLLFQALAADAELQAELADAIRINSAAQQERLETLPPVAVTAALFEKIGSSRPIPTSAPPVLLPATGVSSMVSPDRPPLQNQRREEEPERKRRLGAFLMPLAAGALGALLTLVIVGDPFGTGRSVESVESPRIAQQSETTGQNLAEMRGSDITPEGETGTTLPATDAPTEQKSTISPRRPATTVVTASTTDLASREIVPHSTPQPDLRRSRSSDLVLSPEENALLESVERESTPAIDFATLRLPPADAWPIDLPRQSVVEELRIDDLLAETPTPEEKPNYSVFLRGAGALGTWPDRSKESLGASGEPEAFALGGLYHLNETHAVGFHAGRDHHPFYVRRDRQGGEILSTLSPVTPELDESPVILNHVGGGGVDGGRTIDMTEGEKEGLIPGNPGGGNSNFTGTITTDLPETVSPASTEQTTNVDPSVEWVGLSYRLKGGAIDRLGMLRPIAQTTLGLSSVGPLGRASVGLAWKPGSRVSLTAGVEGRALLYQQSGNWYSSRQIGLEYGVEVEF